MDLPNEAGQIHQVPRKVKPRESSNESELDRGTGLASINHGQYLLTGVDGANPIVPC
jgi:hypothetical protein